MIPMTKLQPKQLSSLDNDHMTPEWVVEGFLAAFGGFNLDPASSALANKTVGAKDFYDKRGLQKPWYGCVFLNPPGGLVDEAGNTVIRKAGDRLSCTETGGCGIPRGHAHKGVTSSAVRWWSRMVAEFTECRISGGGFVGFSLELLQSVQAQPVAHPLTFTCCFPAKRIQFDTVRDGKRVPGKQPTHSNVLVCMSPSPLVRQRFTKYFSEYGFIHEPDSVQHTTEFSTKRVNALIEECDAALKALKEEFR